MAGKAARLFSRIDQFIKFRGFGRVQGGQDLVGGGGAGDGAPVGGVAAEAAGLVVGLDQEAPAGVVGRPVELEVGVYLIGLVLLLSVEHANYVELLRLLRLFLSTFRAHCTS